VAGLTSNFLLSVARSLVLATAAALLPALSLAMPKKKKKVPRAQGGGTVAALSLSRALRSSFLTKPTHTTKSTRMKKKKRQQQ